MKPSEVRELSEKERQEKIRDNEEELFNLRFQMATGKIENPGRIRIIRRDVARLKTIQKELVATVEENASEDKGEES
jgi:large subunit ribosomal protein L29